MRTYIFRLLLTSLAALAAAGLATVVRWGLDPVLGDHFPFATYLVVVTVLAWGLGWRPAVVMLIAGFFLANHFFIAPRGSLHIAAAAQTFGAAVYFFVGLTIALFSALMKSAQQRAEDSAQRASSKEAALRKEIARRQQAEEGLLLRERQLAALVESSPDVVGRLDRSLRHLYISPAVTRYTGLKPEAFLGKTGVEAGLPAELWRSFEVRCREAIVTGEPVRHEFTHVTPAGTRHMETRLIPEPGANGMVASLLLITADITDRRRAELALRESEERLRLTVDAAGAGLGQWNILNGDMRWDERCFRLFGYEPGSFDPSYDHWRCRVHPDDLAEIEAKAMCCARDHLDLHCEYRILLPDGATRWVRMSGRFHWDEDGAPVWVSVICFDITAAKEAELALAKSEREFRAMFALSGVGQLQIDPGSGRLTRVNRRFCELTGYAEQELLDMSVGTLTHADDRASDEACWRRLLSGDEPEYVIEKRLRRKDGTLIWAHMTATLVRSAAGQPLHTAAVVQDITTRKLAEEESLRLNRELSQADRRKDEFLAVLAHELRNPLAPLRNALEILKRAPDNAALSSRARGTMERQVTQMVRLIDDLLDLSRISRDKLELRKERVDARSVVQHALETCRPQIDGSGHEFVLTMPDRPLPIDADPVRLTQVLCNLISNACKYSEPGGHIALTVERTAEELSLVIEDRGLGIPPDMLPEIFTMFTQVDRSLERSQGGLGIGLALARRLVEMHGGSIGAESEGPGRGSRFTVRLPATGEAAVPEPGPEAPAPGGFARGRRVLVADDNRDAAESLALLLRLGGGDEVHVAYDGEEAVAMAARLRPDVILLDLGMPRLDGYEAAAAIRRQPWGRAIVLAALTGWGQDEDRRRSRAAGFDHHFVKPVDAAALARLFEPAPVLAPD